MAYECEMSLQTPEDAPIFVEHIATDLNNCYTSALSSVVAKSHVWLLTMKSNEIKCKTHFLSHFSHVSHV